MNENYNIDREIRKYELIVLRLKKIKELGLILEGKDLRYKNNMNSYTFIEDVKRNLKMEKDLLEDLLTEE